MKRSITLSGHRTSISLEDPFWQALHEISQDTKKTPTQLINVIDAKRQPKDNLSSAIRIYILDYFKKKIINNKNI